ncbi:MAG TPA: hypothetical protein VM677_27205 [Actinokineospora sp.]|nr:hypothetical protein [Actinokineospora sp.]
MALSIGELVGYLTLDNSKFDAGLGQAEGQMQGFGQRAGQIFAGVGVGAGAAFTAGLVEAMDADQASDKLAAQLDLTAEQSERMGHVAGALYADAYGASLAEVNDAVGAVVSSIDGMRNASGDAVQDITAKVLDLAAAFEVDVGRSAQVAGQLVKSGLAKDATEALDMITLGLQRVPAAVREDLIDALDEYAPFMQALGVKGEAALGLLIQASDKGAFGLDKMGDALKEFLILSTDMGPASKAGYDALGLSQEKMTKQLLAGGDTAKAAFEQIVGGLGKITDPAKQSQAALALFGTPLEDLSVQEIPAFLESLLLAGEGMDDLSGAADRFGATLNDNAATNLEVFWRTLKTKVVDFIGGKVLPVVNDFASFLARNVGPAIEAAGRFIADDLVPALSAMASWIGQNSTWLSIVAAVIMGLFVPALIAMGVNATISAYKVVAAWILQRATSIASLTAQGAAILVMVGQWILLGTQALIQGARIAAGWIMAMGPIGWIIAAVVGLVALIVANWESVKQWTVDAWNAIWKWVSDRITDIRDTVQARIRDVLSFFEWFAQLPGKVSAWFGSAKDWAVRKLSELIDWVAGLPGRVLGAIGDIGSKLVQVGKDIIGGIVRGLGDAASWIWEKLKQIVSDAWDSVLAFFGINSPSKEGIWAGQMIGRGLALGIASMTDQVSAATGQLSAAARLPGAGDPLGLGLPLGSPGTGAGFGGITAGATIDKLINVERLDMSAATSPREVSTELAWQLESVGG